MSLWIQITETISDATLRWLHRCQFVRYKSILRSELWKLVFAVMCNSTFTEASCHLMERLDKICAYSEHWTVLYTVCMRDCMYTVRTQTTCTCTDTCTCICACTRKITIFSKSMQPGTKIQLYNTLYGTDYVQVTYNMYIHVHVRVTADLVTANCWSIINASRQIHVHALEIRHKVSRLWSVYLPSFISHAHWS